jgi:hypothetical protein
MIGDRVPAREGTGEGLGGRVFGCGPVKRSSLVPVT